MKLGGRNEISTPEAIVGLLILVTICLIMSFWEPFRVLGRVFASIAGTGIIILWQIDLNSIYRESKVDSDKWGEWKDFFIFEHFKNKK